MANLGQAYVQIVPSAEGLAGSISKAIGGEADSAGKSAGLKIGDTIKKLIIGGTEVPGCAVVEDRSYSLK